jgi:hypothetical protein
MSLSVSRPHPHLRVEGARFLPDTPAMKLQYIPGGITRLVNGFHSSRDHREAELFVTNPCQTQISFPCKETIASSSCGRICLPTLSRRIRQQGSRARPGGVSK